MSDVSTGAEEAPAVEPTTDQLTEPSALRRRVRRLVPSAPETRGAQPAHSGTTGALGAGGGEN